MLATLVDNSTTAVAMCAAGGAVLVIGLVAGRKAFAEAPGLDRIVALANVWYAVPMAVFGALHLFGPGFVKALVPPYMPGRMFWVYFVGCALVAGSLSIALRIGVKWSGLLLGTMMFLFVAMIHFPGALRQPHNRIIWTIVFRESSFGGAGWILAVMAVDGWRGKPGDWLMKLGRLAITLALIDFGIEHFVYPTSLPGVPLERQLPDWVPMQVVIGYLTGAALLATAASVMLGKKERLVATCAGGWLLLLVLVIYVPVLVSGLADPGIGPKIEGINYFADTLLFAGVVLALASTRPRLDERGVAIIE